MYLFIETLRINNRKIENISAHNKRLNSTRFELLKSNNILNIEDFVDLSGVPDEGVYKCRLVYSHKILEVDISPYSIRKTASLKLVYCSDIDYSYKYADRSRINFLFEQRGSCDDIIVVRNNQLTDSSYCNLIFCKDNYKVTPSNPLLKGTQRNKLVYENFIKEELIRVEDLKFFSSVKMINAMIPFENAIEIPICQIQ